MADDNGKREELEREIASLKEDLTKLQGDLKHVAETAVDAGRDTAHQAREQASKQWQEGVDAARTYVEEKPMAVVIGAFLVGMVMGTLFGRK